MTQPILYIVVPCYNEEAVLPITGPMFLEKLRELTESGQIREESRVLFVNDGSSDRSDSLLKSLGRNPTPAPVGRARPRTQTQPQSGASKRPFGGVDDRERLRRRHDFR